MDTVHPIYLPEDQDPVKLEACRAYARMVNTFDYSALEPWLADDMEYESQRVISKLVVGSSRASHDF